jgi:hypothetical protein
MDHLTLAAAVLSAKHLDPSTITGYMTALHCRFGELFPALGISSMTEWRPARHIPVYLRGEMLADHTPYMRAHPHRVHHRDRPSSQMA